MLDPLHASRRIHEEYRRYLSSTFPLRRADLREDFEAQLEADFPLAKGPILQAAAPYLTGACVERLIAEGVLDGGFRRLADAFPLERPLYHHQELALRKAVEGRRNLIVATGTGSGKTECFLLPIIDALLREGQAGTLGRPGVRALLLYPMNALANDQLKRLRVLLRNLPSITFGRYVGETETEQAKAESRFRQRYPHEPRLENELISRQVMQDRPPHILLTNFAMLEYLLLRPNDSALFDGATGEHWRFLALDEIHVYGGAQGSEIAMLVRRVKDRVNGSRRGALQCFGTSATLGRGVADYPELVQFAEALFDEPFEWAAGDPGRQDIVGAERKPLARGEVTGRLDDARLPAIRALARGDASSAELAAAAGVADRTGQPGDVLTDALAGDERVLRLQALLQHGSVDLRTAASELFDGPDAVERLVDLIDLGVMARHREDDAPLIPARYHFFLRALEGAFLCLHPEHPSDRPSLLLSRHRWCPVCADEGREAVMVELASCRHCGAEYAVGKLADGEPPRRLEHAPPMAERPLRLLLGDAADVGVDDEDEDLLTGELPEEAVAAWLCAGCGAVSERDVFTCECQGASTPIRVWIARASGGQKTRRCLACARRTGGDPVSRFLTGSDAPVSVIATDLYQEIPPSTEPRLRAGIGEGRKLLMFSDSRQDAAFFAPYLENTYRRAVERRLIADAVESMRGLDASVGDLVTPIVRTARDALVLDPDDSGVKHRNAAATWLTRELVALDRRQSLEGTGIAEIRLVFPRHHEPPAPLIAMGFTPAEADNLIRLLLDTLRLGGAINVLEGADITDPAFAPRNKELSVWREGSAPRVLSWLPNRGLNRRRDLVTRILARKGIDGDPSALLDGLWRFLTDPAGAWTKTLVPIHGHPDGAVWRLDSERYAIVPGIPERAPQRCDRCGQMWWVNVADACPSFRCDGTLRTVDDPEHLAENHYARLYRELEPIGMSVEEHTAQWVASKASAIQDDFTRGRINVLSCSTTFELGVDVGEVQAVLLRNVPPSPANYVQRAGRAGRRTDAAALVVTFAQRRSHDLTYFDAPDRMVDGLIPPPRVVLDNAPITRRHVHSVAFAAYQREIGDHRSVADFFITQHDGATRDQTFVQWLRSRPDEVGAAVRRVVPEPLHEVLGLDDWAWVEALVTDTDEEPTHGWLDRAAGEVRADVAELERLIEEASEEKRFPQAAKLQRVQKAITSRRLLDFLASRNVLPKYGFPVDVVELNLTRSGDETAGNLDLSRDLTMAISDYAPGAVTVAGKKLWRSDGLVIRNDRSWPRYGWAVCDGCGGFRHKLEEFEEACPSCGSVAATNTGRFVMPIYGFVGSAVSSVGESRPTRSGMRETYFGSYRGEPPPFVPVAELAGGASTELRFSRQGRITVINKGPVGRGFRLCDWCGFGQPVGIGEKPPKKHKRADRPGVDCAGPLQHASLGHEYLTDVVEIRLTAPSLSSDARSALYALLGASEAIDIARDDIDGTLHYYEANHPVLVLFDAVPGGAGHTARVGARLPALVTAALERAGHCECGIETSCYSCLRSYGNQIWHEMLSRAGAIRALSQITGKGF
jgi:hypothetical protein